MTDLTVTPAVPTTRPADRRIDIRTAIDQYRTCELATLSRNGVPIAWPAVFDWDPATDRIVLTTSISFPQKAFNIRRDPRVALLFSDPTGTGRTDLPQILVRGTAGCPEQIHPGTTGLERYWQRLAQRQPASRTYGANRFSRRLFDWYYLRLVITVTPVEVSTAPAADRRPMGGAAVATPADGGAWARLAQELPGFSGAVLGTAADGELPVLRRVRLTPAPGSGAFSGRRPGPRAHRRAGVGAAAPARRPAVEPAPDRGGGSAGPIRGRHLDVPARPDAADDVPGQRGGDGASGDSGPPDREPLPAAARAGPAGDRLGGPPGVRAARRPVGLGRRGGPSRTGAAGVTQVVARRPGVC